jgi:DnaK suppressor protein
MSPIDPTLSQYRDDAAVRDWLKARRSELEHRSAQVRSDIRHESDPLVADFADQATQRENDEVLAQIGDSAAIEIAQIRHALARLERGEYRNCAQCGEEIAAERLRVVPYTDRCTSCAK